MGTKIVAMDRNTHTIQKVAQNTAYDRQEDMDARLAMRKIITDFMASQ